MWFLNFIHGIKYFQDHEGKPSSNRLNAFLLHIVALFVIVWQVVSGEVDHGLIFELLAVVFGIKYIGKQQENTKFEKTLETEVKLKNGETTEQKQVLKD